MFTLYLQKCRVVPVSERNYVASIRRIRLDDKRQHWVYDDIAFTRVSNMRDNTRSWRVKCTRVRLFRDEARKDCVKASRSRYNGLLSVGMPSDVRKNSEF